MLPKQTKSTEIGSGLEAISMFWKIIDSEEGFVGISEWIFEVLGHLGVVLS
jgi:hypothetical protein